MKGDVEVSKKTHDTKSTIEKERLETQSMQKHLRKIMDDEIKMAKENVNKGLEDINTQNYIIN